MLPWTHLPSHSSAPRSVGVRPFGAVDVVRDEQFLRTTIDRIPGSGEEMEVPLIAPVGKPMLNRGFSPRHFSICARSAVASLNPC
jgi:hypothetical protein